MVVIGPFNRDDWKMMKTLKLNVNYFRSKQRVDVADKYRSNLKEYFRKVA